MSLEGTSNIMPRVSILLSVSISVNTLFLRKCIRFYLPPAWFIRMSKGFCLTTVNQTTNTIFSPCLFRGGVVRFFIKNNLSQSIWYLTKLIEGVLLLLRLQGFINKNNYLEQASCPYLTYRAFGYYDGWFSRDFRRMQPSWRACSFTVFLHRWSWRDVNEYLEASLCKSCTPAF